MPDLVPPADFKAAMRRFASGVTVVTCISDGVDHAMTATAFSAVSLDPPLVLLCVNREARFSGALRTTDWWGVSVLDRDGEAAARWYSTKGRPLQGQLDRFGYSRGASGVALFDGCLAQLECRTEEVVRAGDHDVVIGAVASVRHVGDQPPLLYWEGRYHGLI